MERPGSCTANTWCASRVRCSRLACGAHARASTRARRLTLAGPTAHRLSLTGRPLADRESMRAQRRQLDEQERARRSRSTKTCRNPLFGLFRCRYPRKLPNRLPIRRPAFGGSKRQLPRAHSSRKHRRLDGFWADAVWRQKRIGHSDGSCVRRGPRSRCGLFLHVPIWHSRVVADPSSSRRSAAPAHTTPSLDWRRRFTSAAPA